VLRVQHGRARHRPSRRRRPASCSTAGTRGWSIRSASRASARAASSPPASAASNHKYDTADYRHIDPHFGSEADFSRLMAEVRVERGTLAFEVPAQFGRALISR